jgi:hypothetical protein
MANEQRSTSPLYEGQWVVITELGPYFGRTGELLKSPDKNKADWVVIIDCRGIGVGFDEVDLMPDPRVWC